MGKLYYAAAADGIEMPDRILAHLKVLISTKLRRSESFSLSWDHLADDGETTRSCIWLHSAIPLQFEFDAAAAGQLDGGYLQDLATAASSSTGVVIDLRDDLSLRERTTASLVRAA